MKWWSSSAIVVDITPAQVTFSDMDGAPVSLTPVVWLAADDRNRILAVGAAPPIGASAIRVEVFSSDAPPTGVSKLACLVALFIQGLKTILGRSIFPVKPEVLVRGVETLSGGLGGYERDVLAYALAQAGARRVRWPDEFVAE